MSKFGVIWRKALYNAAFKTPLRQLFFGPQFMFTPGQLIRLCELAEEASKVQGNFLEIGAAWASTTIFLNNYLREKGLCPSYTILDTFAGFTQTDVKYEIQVRGTSSRIRHSFTLNDFQWVSQRLKENDLGDVSCIEVDAVKFDYESIKPIAFSLIDLDLYLPIRTILPIVYELTIEGGIIVVDNCDKNNQYWNGAYQAYDEFTNSHNIVKCIELNKLGIIHK